MIWFQSARDELSWRTSFPADAPWFPASWSPAIWTSTPLTPRSERSAVASISAHRLRRSGAGAEALGRFWSGLLTGVNELHGGIIATWGSIFTGVVLTTTPEAGFAWSTGAGVIVRAGVATGLPQQPRRTYLRNMNSIKTTIRIQMHHILLIYFLF